MGLLCWGEVVPFSAVRMGFIYREIESVSRRGNLNQYWSLIRPVLVTARSSIGIYCQSVLVGRATSTGSFFFLYRLLCTVGEEGCSVSVGVAIFARADMAGGGRGFCALCLFEYVAIDSQVSFLQKGVPLLLIEYGELS